MAAPPGQSGATYPRARDPIRNLQIVCLGSGIGPTQQAL